MAARGKRRRGRPPAPCCAAEGCVDFPLYGLRLEGAHSRVWVCARHQRFNHLDNLRVLSMETIIRHAAQLFIPPEHAPLYVEGDSLELMVRRMGELEREQMGPVLR